MSSLTALTGAQFDQLSFQEGRKWELVDGELIPMSSPTAEHQDIVRIILFAFHEFLSSHPGLGRAYADLEFALDNDYRVRPGVLVLGLHKSANLDRKRIPVPGSPDLCVEVISPSQRAGEIRAKLQAYQRFGTEEVWHVYPERRSIAVYRDGGSKEFSSGAITSPLLPGFALAVDQIFID